MTKYHLPPKEWWSAQELADAGLPDVPPTKRAVNMLAERQHWQANPTYARKREGRGGGWEYHWRLLPVRSQRELIARVNQPVAPKARLGRDEAWQWFDGLPASVKEKARHCLKVIQEVEALAPAMAKFLAVSAIATQNQIADRTIWSWFERVEGVDAADRLPYLAPRHRATPPKGMKAVAAPEFYAYLKSNYLRLEAPEFTQCWRDAVAICEAEGLATLGLRTAYRWLDANVKEIDQIFARKGMKGLRERFPPQIRDRSNMVSMEMLNADCHKIDVFVWWPGIKEPVRPQLIVWQDVYSGKILSWEIDLNPNKVAVMQAFMKVLRDYGIPGHCLFDNGMEFANKDLTGGAKHRFRFTVSDDEPHGILSLLGVGISFATPAHGQAKPIERGFRDFASDIAKDIRFAGAYVGNHIDAKPENYMSKAIDLADFVPVVEQRVAEHNARLGRKSHTANGRSFDLTFAESLRHNPPRPATEEQMRLCLMAQYVRTLHQKNGQITLFKNLYWSEWMSEIAGQKVTARFNPEDLHEGAYLYSMAGEFIGYAACRHKSQFRDIASAKALAKENRRRAKDFKARVAEHRQIPLEHLGAKLNSLATSQASLPEATVVQLDRLAQIEQRRKTGGLIKPPLPTPDTSRDAELRVLQVDFSATRVVSKDTSDETDVTRFWRMIDIEKRSKAGEPISADDAEFHARWQRHPTYRAQRAMYDRDGAVAIG